MTTTRMMPSRGYLDGLLWVPVSHVNLDGLKRALTVKTQVDGQEEDFPLYTLKKNHIGVPREFWPPGQFSFEVIDLRPQSYPRVNFGSKIKLDHRRDKTGALVATGKDVQARSVAAMHAANGGVLQLSCGSGKTLTSLELIARLQMPAIVLADNIPLLEQWEKEINWNMSASVGWICDGFCSLGDITLATYQSIAAMAVNESKQEFLDVLRRHVGVAVFEEAHHLGAPTFSRTASLFYNRRYGLSATPYRADGMHRLIETHLGPVLHKDLSQDLVPQIFFVQTDVKLDLNDRNVVEQVCDVTGEIHMGKLAICLGRDKRRLNMILGLVAKELAARKKVLVLSKSVEEASNLFALMTGQACYMDITKQPDTTQLLTDRKVRSIQEKLAMNIATDSDKALFEAHQAQVAVGEAYESGWMSYLRGLATSRQDVSLLTHKTYKKTVLKNQVTFAIMKYGKEGYDDKDLDTVIMCAPVKDEGAIQQIVGRTLRAVDRYKEPRLYVIEDDVDVLHALCGRMRHAFKNYPTDAGGPYKWTFGRYNEIVSGRLGPWKKDGGDQTLAKQFRRFTRTGSARLGAGDAPFMNEGKQRTTTTCAARGHLVASCS